MTRPRWIALAAAVGLVSGAAVAADGKGDGRSKPGRDDCGQDLVVVLPDGTKRQYVPAQSLLSAYSAVQINQGEKPRPAVKMEDVLKELGAAWAEALDCDNKSVHLPSQLPFEGQEYLVVTGRGTIKVVREVQRGRYANVAQGIRKLTLHGADGKKR